jgi:hypothetical protein
MTYPFTSLSTSTSNNGCTTSELREAYEAGGPLYESPSAENTLRFVEWLDGLAASLQVIEELLAASSIAERPPVEAVAQNVTSPSGNAGNPVASGIGPGNFSPRLNLLSNNRLSYPSTS